MPNRKEIFMKDDFKIKKTPYRIVMNIICLLMIIGIFLYLIVNWGNIPDKIPGHYDFAGNVDRWGNKSELWICPIITVILYIGLSIIEKFPQIWNTGVEVTEKNREQVYGILRNMLVTLKGIMVAVFVFITVYSKSAKPMPIWFLPVFLILVFGAIIISIKKLLKAR